LKRCMMLMQPCRRVWRTSGVLPSRAIPNRWVPCRDVIEHCGSRGKASIKAVDSNLNALEVWIELLARHRALRPCVVERCWQGRIPKQGVHKIIDLSRDALPRVGCERDDTARLHDPRPALARRALCLAGTRTPMIRPHSQGGPPKSARTLGAENRSRIFNRSTNKGTRRHLRRAVNDSLSRNTAAVG
jgi:hypothetical protein